MLETFQVLHDKEEQQCLQLGINKNKPVVSLPRYEDEGIGDNDLDRGAIEESEDELEDLPDEVLPRYNLPGETYNLLTDLLQLQDFPTHDALKNKYVWVIHTNGVHHMALLTCACQGADAVHADLAYSKLILASFTTYQTLFTVNVLDDFRLTNLECKA